MRILNSGSDGNSTIISDNQENCIVIDCGLSYDMIISKLDIRKLDCVLVTHCH